MLAECLDRLNYPQILKVSIVRFEVLTETISSPKKALHLQLLEDKTLVLYSDDTAVVQKALRSHHETSISLRTPHQIWGTGPLKRLDRMLLTPRLAQVIDDISEEGDQLQRVYILWKDYELVQLKKPVGEKLEIAGEFMEFSARSFRGMLVIFDLVR